MTKGKVSFKNIVGYIFQEINAKIRGIFGKEWDICSEPSGNDQKQLLKHNHLEKTLVLKQILVLVLRWPQKMKTMKLWSLIGLTCLLVHIILAEDQVNKTIPRYSSFSKFYGKV